MVKIKPKTCLGKLAGEVVIKPNGTMNCAAGYELIETDKMGVYTCSANVCRYELDPNAIEQDKYGNLYIEPLNHSGEH